MSGQTVCINVARAFQHREGRVALVEVTYLGLDPERGQQPPPADAKHQFLLRRNAAPPPYNSLVMPR